MDISNKTAVFDKMFFPKKPNYEYTTEYFHSKATEQQRKIGTYDTGDNIERNVTISNYLAKKQLEKTTKKLNVKRKEYQEKRIYVLDQWEDLKKKEEGLRQNFIRFNQFMKENQEKKERAANKIIEQNALKKERQKRMYELLDKCNQITKVKAQMDKNIGQYRIYEKFLITVVDYESSIQSIGDLLKRYEALIGARKELNDIQQRDLNKLEKAKSNLSQTINVYLHKIETIKNKVQALQERYDNATTNCQNWEKIYKNIKLQTADTLLDIMKLIEEKNFIIMGLNNQIANLQARYENANIKALESETLVTQIKNNAVRQLSEINMVKNSIWNMYVHMAASKKHPIKIKRENVEEQMMYINRTLTELSKVNRLIKKRSTKSK